MAVLREAEPEAGGSAALSSDLPQGPSRFLNMHPLSLALTWLLVRALSSADLG